MFNRSDWSDCSNNNNNNNSDRFISQFHDNLVKVTFNHFKKQNEEVKRKVEQQKDYNDQVRQKIQNSKEENISLQKESDRFKTQNEARTEDYEKIAFIIRSELEDVVNKIQEMSLKAEIKGSSKREYEVETDKLKNKLTVEIQKLEVMEKKLDLLKIKLNGLEENQKSAKEEIQKLKKTLDTHKSQLIYQSTIQKQTEMKYTMAKEFGKNMIDNHDRLILSQDLANREKQSLLFSKALHERVNARLVNVIIMNNIMNDQMSVRQMLMTLDTLNSEYSERTNKVIVTDYGDISECSSVKICNGRETNDSLDMSKDETTFSSTKFDNKTNMSPKTLEKPLEKSMTIKKQIYTTKDENLKTIDRTSHGSPEGGDNNFVKSKITPNHYQRSGSNTFYQEKYLTTSSEESKLFSSRIDNNGKPLPFADDVLLLYRNTMETNDSSYD